MRLTGYRLCEQCFTGSRRTHEERSLRQLCTDLCIFLRVVQEIDDLHKGFLRLILTCNIRERDSGLLLDVDLGVALSDAHHSSAAHPAVHHIEKSDHQCRRKYPSHQEIQDAGTRTRIFCHHMDSVGV